MEGLPADLDERKDERDTNDFPTSRREVPIRFPFRYVSAAMKASIKLIASPLTRFQYKNDVVR